MLALFTSLQTSLLVRRPSTLAKANKSPVTPEPLAGAGGVVTLEVRDQLAARGVTAKVIFSTGNPRAIQDLTSESAVNSDELSDLNG